MFSYIFGIDSIPQDRLPGLNVLYGRFLPCLQLCPLTGAEVIDLNQIEARLENDSFYQLLTDPRPETIMAIFT
jgi:hypothetical protein